VSGRGEGKKIETFSEQGSCFFTPNLFVCDLKPHTKFWNVNSFWEKSNGSREREKNREKTPFIVDT
jgi:hypothetical protein